MRPHSRRYMVPVDEHTPLPPHCHIQPIREIIGADRLIFQDLEDLKEAIRIPKVPEVSEFDCSVFDGVYVTGDIDEAYLDN